MKKVKSTESEILNFIAVPTENNLTFNQATENNLVFNTNNGKQILRLEENGNIFVHGRLIENDQELVSCLQEIILGRKSFRPSNLKSIVGFCGYAQSGKDEATKVAVEMGYVHVALAEKVRQGVYNINPWVNVIRTDDEKLFVRLRPHSKLTRISEMNVRLRDVVNTIGWDVAKSIPEVRRLLQYYGTQGAREIFGDDIWTSTADKYIDTKNIEYVAISDVRFSDEVTWLKKKGGNLIKIVRPDVGPVNGHISDAGIPDEMCDAVINNDSTLEELKEQVATVLTKLSWKGVLNNDN